MPMPVAVNLSARQFHDGRLVADIAAILAAAGLAPGELELEITESTVMQNPEQAVTLMDELRRLGRAARDGRFRHRLLVDRSPEALSRSTA